MITGQTLRDAILSGANNIANQRTRVDELNVFPVPDGDTGTNMSMTIGAARAELEAMPDTCTVAEASKTAASAMLRGARGNSGVILSLLFRGISKTLKGAEDCDGVLLAAALNGGVEAAYKAVMKPTEGTILTVARVSAADALATESADVEAVLQAAVTSAEQALAETVHQNPVLEKAGVVDAGGKGWLYVLEAMLSVCRGVEIEPNAPAGEVKEQADFAELGDGDITFAFDTVYIMRKASENVDLEPLRAYLNTIGDSIVIGEDDESFKVHVHTDIPGQALTESQKYGTLELAKIENMRTQRDDLAAGRQAHSTDDLDAVEEELEAQENAVAPAEKRYGFVAVCAGDGLADTFRALGVDTIVSGGQTMNPSTEAILKEVNRTPSEVVFILPNNKNIIMAAQQCEGLTEKQIIVIPTATVPQGITAMMSFDPDENDPQTIAQAMVAAAQTVSTAQITYAARNSDFDGFAINEGDYLALLDGKLFGTSRSMDELLEKLSQHAAQAGAEYINIYTGEGVSEDDGAKTEALFAQSCPDAEVAAIPGGQSVYFYIISIE